MKMDVQCVACQMKRHMALLEQVEGDKMGYMREVLTILADLPEDASAPCSIPACDAAFAKYFTPEDMYADIKKRSNQYVMDRLGAVQNRMDRAKDPILMGIRFSRMGNYIDFGVLPDLDMDKFDELLAKAAEDAIDETEYFNFRHDLEKAKKLVFLTDNAGEIVLDKILLEAIHRTYPALDICVGVRGSHVVNDATREDAALVGIEEVARLCDNGSGIPGTYLPKLGEELKREMETADLILSKGQGNFETLHDCGLNIYYIFLCKCKWFAEMFHAELMQGMFVNERRLDF